MAGSSESVEGQNLKEQHEDELVSLPRKDLQKLNTTQEEMLKTVQQFLGKLTQMETKVDDVHNAICGTERNGAQQQRNAAAGCGRLQVLLEGSESIGCSAISQTVPLSSHAQTQSNVDYSSSSLHTTPSLPLKKDDSGGSFDLTPAELELLDRSACNVNHDASDIHRTDAPTVSPAIVSPATVNRSQISLKPFVFAGLNLTNENESQHGSKSYEKAVATTKDCSSASKDVHSAPTTTGEVSVVVHDDGNGKVQTIVPGGLTVSWTSTVAGININRSKYLQQMHETILDVVGVALSIEQLCGVGADPSQNFYEVFSLLMTHIVSEEIGIVYSGCQVFLTGFFNNADDGRTLTQYLEELPEPVYTAAKFCSEIMFLERIVEEKRLSVVRAAVADVQTYVTCYTDYQSLSG